MGFGHRVYKNFDPRARIIKKAADDVLESLGIEEPVLEVAKGTLVLLHGRLPHYSSENKSLKSRLAYTLHIFEGN